MDELKLEPCPFCGGEAHMNWSHDNKESFVECDLCGAEGASSVHSELRDQQAADNWNRRQPQSAEWVPWKEGDPLPVPGEYVVLRDHRRGENDPARWSVIAECVQLPSGELTWWPKGRPMQPVVAYLPAPLPDPYTDAQGKRLPEREECEK